MKLYNCTVSIGKGGGNINPHHEVPRIGVTKAEVVVLRSIHGMDAVKDLKETVELNKPDMEIYAELATRYKRSTVEQLFNVRLENLSEGMEENLMEGLEDAPYKPEADIPEFTKKRVA